MGRRALPKIDLQLDLSRWLVAEDELPEKIPDRALFGRSAPLEIEVGSGKGLFLARATQMNQDHDFLGIEIAGKYAQFAAAGLAKQQSANGKLIRGDGVLIFRHRVLSDSLAAVHVYFPDPWWKQRHRKRRLIHAAFLHDVQRVLRSGGTLHFWTDVREYFETTLKLIRQETDLQGPVMLAEPVANHDSDYRTHFERRMRMHSEPVYRCQFEKL